MKNFLGNWLYFIEKNKKGKNIKFDFFAYLPIFWENIYRVFITMHNIPLEQILDSYTFFDKNTLENLSLSPLGNGFINDTFLLEIPTQSEKYVLQRVNTAVFPRHEAIENNLLIARRYLENNPDFSLFLPFENTQ